MLCLTVQLSTIHSQLEAIIEDLGESLGGDCGEPLRTTASIPCSECRVLRARIADIESSLNLPSGALATITTADATISGLTRVPAVSDLATRSAEEHAASCKHMVGLLRDNKEVSQN